MFSHDKGKEKKPPLSLIIRIYFKMTVSILRKRKPDVSCAISQSISI